MLLALMMRDWRSGAVRSCTNAYSGTMNRPPKNPSSAMSARMRAPPWACKNSVQPNRARPPAASALGIAAGSAAEKCAADNARSAVNNDKPIEPTGTSPISTLCPDKRSHITAPSATPMEKTASRLVTTVVSPRSTSLPIAGI